MLKHQYAHWHQYFEDIPISPLDFYKSLRAALKTNQVPEIIVNNVEFLEGGPLSAERAYLEIRHDWLTYHVCAAPFGTGFFVSSRLLVSPFETWPVMGVIAGGICALLALLFIILSGSYSIGVAFLITAALAIPAFFLFAIGVAIWIWSCLRLTYYRLDSMIAFQEAIHRLLVATVNAVIEAAGRKPLSEQESKPILHKLLQR